MTKRELGVALEQLCAVFGHPAGWAVAAALYLDALADLTPELLCLAVKRCVRNHPKFFPTPAEIRAQVQPELAELGRLHRDKIDAWYRPRQEAEPKSGRRYEEMSVGERAAFDAKMDAHFAAYGGRSRPRGDAIRPNGSPTSWRPLREILAEAASIMAPADRPFVGEE